MLLIAFSLAVLFVPNVFVARVVAHRQIPPPHVMRLLTVQALEESNLPIPVHCLLLPRYRLLWL